MIIDLLVEEKKAKKIIETAENKAKDLIKESQEKAETILREAISEIKVDQMTREDNVKTTKEALEIGIEYSKKMEYLKNKAKSHIDQAVQYVIKEVLCVDRD